MSLGPDASNVRGAILFDLDGTLIDSAPSLTRGLNVFVQRRGGAPVSDAEVRSWISLGGETMIRGALGDKAGNPETDIAEFRSILREQKGNPSDLFPGVAAALRALRQQGYKIALCTNKREDIANPLIRDLGIDHLIDGVAGGAPGHTLKPSRFLADLALERIGYQGGAIVFVGDSEVDAETAAVAGFPFILVSFGYPVGDINAIVCQKKIDRFSDLPDAVENVLAKR